MTHSRDERYQELSLVDLKALNLFSPLLDTIAALQFTPDFLWYIIRSVTHSGTILLICLSLAASASTQVQQQVADVRILLPPEIPSDK
ncbi:MAG TPA: hypothetical protein VEI52_11530, partial [Terriglobales bacterium]|nr:hypothetical protein [Terriglobales bacterium]